MLAWGETIGFHKVVRQRDVLSKSGAKRQIGKILDFLVDMGPVRLAYLAIERISEHGFDTAAGIVRQQRNRPGRGNRCQMAVADAMFGDQRAYIGVQRLNHRGLEIVVGVK